MKLGIEDPEQWLELQPERVIAFWEAFDQRRPIGCEWEQYAGVMGMLEMLMAAVINPNLDKSDRITPRGTEQFLPPALRETKSKPKKLTLQQQLQLLAKVYGGTYGNDNQ